MGIIRPILFASTLLFLGSARAHFALIAPVSALSTEDGGKGGPPCGQGVESNIVTEVLGGHPLPLRFQEFVFHPGHYRVALAVKSRDELPADPDVVADPDGISISAPIQNPPKIPVLADGLLAHTNPPPGEWSTQIVLPNINCEKCTLQIIEFMAEHGPSYFYHHCADLKIKADPNLPPADSAWPRDASNPNPLTNAVLSHVADGGGWQTAITLVNLDSVPAQFTLKFWGDDGFPLPPGTVGGTINVGGSQTIRTDGSPPAKSTGWVQLISPQLVDGIAILRAPPAGQEVSIRFQANGSPRLFFPFDNTDGAAMEIALASTTGPASLTLRNQQGQTISEEPPLSVPLNGHTSFVLPLRSADPKDVRGVARIDQSNGSIFGVGLRANQGSLTSVEAVTSAASSPKTIPHVAAGGGWKTTIILVNCDNTAASFTLNFLADDGKGLPLPVTGTIPEGGAQTIETSGLPADTVTGWAEVLSSQCVGGTAIYRMQSSGQEATAPMLSGGGRKLVMPFDSGQGLTLGIAIANISAIDDTAISVTLRDEQGAIISNPAPIALARRQHTSFALPVPAQQRGVVELNSANADIFAIGIRANNGALTYIRALGK